MLLAQDKGWRCADRSNVFVVLLLSLKHLNKQSALAESFLYKYVSPQTYSSLQPARQHDHLRQPLHVLQQLISYLIGLN